MCSFDILFNPRHNVVFERALDHLMEDIGGDQFVNVCTRKLSCEGLP